MEVDINGSKKPIFLWVDRKTKQISFSPVELYRPIWNPKWESSPELAFTDHFKRAGTSA
jgi:hypothetical protein